VNCFRKRGSADQNRRMSGMPKSTMAKRSSPANRAVMTGVLVSQVCSHGVSLQKRSDGETLENNSEVNWEEGSGRREPREAHRHTQTHARTEPKGPAQHGAAARTGNRILHHAAAKYLRTERADGRRKDGGTVQTRKSNSCFHTQTQTQINRDGHRHRQTQTNRRRHRLRRAPPARRRGT
jgi:hypothetical protein